MPAASSTARPSRSRHARHLLAATLLGAAGAALAIRLATPLTLDPAWLAVLVLWLPLLALGGLLELIRRGLGLRLAVAWPFVWTWAARAGDDPVLLWAVPVAVALLLLGLRRRWRAGLALGLVLGAAALLWPGPGQPAAGTRLLVFGLDGATWRQVDKLVAQGRLPNLAAALERGHRARLRSIPPALSPQIWTTLATGYPPQEHGIWDFAATQGELKVGRIWDELRRQQRSFGLCGWYFTSPPLPDLAPGSFIVPSPLDTGDETLPAGFEFFWNAWASSKPGAVRRQGPPAIAREAFRHGVRLGTLAAMAREVVARRFGDTSDFARDWRLRALSQDLQTDIARELLRTRQPEMVAVLYTQLDRISHKYWKFMEPDGFPEVTPEEAARYGGTVDDFYAMADRDLGRLLELLPPDVDLLLISDHGFQAGLGGSAVGWCSVRTDELIAALGMQERLFGTYLDDTLILRPLGDDPAGADSLLARVETALAGARLAGDEAPLLALDRQGPTLLVGLAPRNAVPEGARIALDGREHPFDELVYCGVGATWSGEHLLDGVFVLAGPSAARVAAGDSLHVLDVAPTMAALLGLPRSPGWQGRSAVPPAPGVAVAEALYPLPPAQAAAGKDARDELKEKLRSIGYVR